MDVRLVALAFLWTCMGSPQDDDSRITFEFDQNLSGSCGRASSRVDKTEMNVADTHPGEFPWTLLMLHPVNGSLSPFCGATLIQPRIALTAAYCVDRLSRLNRTQDMIVRAGEWDTNAETESLKHQDREVIFLTAHPRYDGKSSVNKKNHDIALVLVDTPFSITDNVKAICLPGEDDTFEDKRCFVAGWGRDLRDEKNATQRTSMKKVDLPVWPIRECRSKVDIYKRNGFKFPRGTMCAGGEKDKDTCQGDGGSGLVCPESVSSYKYTLAGVVSWGFKCGEQGEPGVYTDVAKYRKWIDDNIRDMKTLYKF